MNASDNNEKKGNLSFIYSTQLDVRQIGTDKGRQVFDDNFKIHPKAPNEKMVLRDMRSFRENPRRGGPRFINITEGKRRLQMIITKMEK